MAETLSGLTQTCSLHEIQKMKRERGGESLHLKEMQSVAAAPSPESGQIVFLQEVVLPHHQTSSLFFLHHKAGRGGPSSGPVLPAAHQEDAILRFRPIFSVLGFCFW